MKKIILTLIITLTCIFSITFVNINKSNADSMNIISKGEIIEKTSNNYVSISYDFILDKNISPNSSIVIEGFSADIEFDFSGQKDVLLACEDYEIHTSITSEKENEERIYNAHIEILIYDFYELIKNSYVYNIDIICNLEFSIINNHTNVYYYYFVNLDDVILGVSDSYYQFSYEDNTYDSYCTYYEINCYFEDDYLILDETLAWDYSLVLRDFNFNDFYYDYGINDGYNEGYSEGTIEGYLDGYDEGLQDGRQEGFTNGKNDVLNNAETYYRDLEQDHKFVEFIDNQKNISFQEGFTNGQSDIFNKMETYYRDLEQNHKFVEFIDNQKNISFQEGFEDGQNVGYESGHAAGVEIGFQEGIDYGLAQAQKDYSSGYEDGWYAAYGDALVKNDMKFSNLLWKIGSIPFESFKHIWNVDFLGLNIGQFVTGLFMAMLAIYVIKKVIK